VDRASTTNRRVDCVDIVDFVDCVEICSRLQIRIPKSAIRYSEMVEAPGIEPGSKSQRRRTLHA